MGRRKRARVFWYARFDYVNRSIFNSIVLMLKIYWWSWRNAYSLLFLHYIVHPLLPIMKLEQICLVLKFSTQLLTTLDSIRVLLLSTGIFWKSGHCDEEGKESDVRGDGTQFEMREILTFFSVLMLSDLLKWEPRVNFWLLFNDIWYGKNGLTVSKKKLKKVKRWEKFYPLTQSDI